MLGKYDKEHTDCAAGLQAYDDPACSDYDSSCRLFLPDGMPRFPPGSFLVNFQCTGEAWRYVPQGCGNDTDIVGPGDKFACSPYEHDINICKRSAAYKNMFPPLPPLCRYSNFQIVDRQPYDPHWMDLLWNVTCRGGWMPSNVTAKAAIMPCFKGGPASGVECDGTQYNFQYGACALQWDAAKKTADDLRKCVAAWGCDWNEW